MPSGSNPGLEKKLRSSAESTANCTCLGIWSILTLIRLPSCGTTLASWLPFAKEIVATCLFTASSGVGTLKHR
jgi:hypothetical protein